MKIGRRDLIGSGPKCLVPDAPHAQQNTGRPQPHSQKKNAGRTSAGQRGKKNPRGKK